MRTWLPAVLIGAVAGFAGLWLRELGWILLTVTLTGLTILYVVQRRIAAIGWLYLAAGTVPTLILGRNILTTFMDPAVEVGPDTYAFMAVAVTIAGVGAIILLAQYLGRR